MQLPANGFMETDGNLQIAMDEDLHGTSATLRVRGSSEVLSRNRAPGLHRAAVTGYAAGCVPLDRLTPLALSPDPLRRMD